MTKEIYKSLRADMATLWAESGRLQVVVYCPSSIMPVSDDGGKTFYNEPPYDPKLFTYIGSVCPPMNRDESCFAVIEGNVTVMHRYVENEFILRFGKLIALAGANLPIELCDRFRNYTEGSYGDSVGRWVAVLLFQCRLCLRNPDGSYREELVILDALSDSIRAIDALGLTTDAVKVPKFPITQIAPIVVEDSVGVDHKDFMINGNYLTAEFCHSNFDLTQASLSRWATHGCPYLGGKLLRRKKFPKMRAFTFSRVDIETIREQRKSDG